MRVTQSHPLRDTISEQVESYILAQWDFTTEEAKQVFLTADISGLACQCFPYALDERIHMAAVLFSVVFLIDANLGEMDIDDGEDYLDHLQDTAKGYWDCDRSRPDAWMLCDLFGEMQSHDYLLVGDIMSATITQLRTRNCQRRLRARGSQDWLSFRNQLLGDEVIGILLKFVMGLSFDDDLNVLGVTSPSSSKNPEESRGRKVRRRGESETWHVDVALGQRICTA